MRHRTPEHLRFDPTIPLTDPQLAAIREDIASGATLGTRGVAAGPDAYEAWLRTHDHAVVLLAEVERHRAAFAANGIVAHHTTPGGTP